MGSLVSEEIRSNGSKAGSSGDNEVIPMELDRTECGQKGHIAKTCPNKQTSNLGTSSSTNANVKQANLIEKE
ncbi:10703_t:CDS:2, partial [Racocetra fulgida]